MSDTAIDVGYSDLNAAPEREAFEPFPAGTYNVQIIEAAVKATADGTGKRLAYKGEILDGPFAKRKFFGGINIVNKSPEAQKIGQAELAELAKALKLQTMPSDCTQLIYRALSAKIKIVPASTKDGKSYDPKNEVQRWMPYGQAEPARASGGNAAGGSTAHAPAASGGNSAAEAAPAATGRRPWQKG